MANVPPDCGGLVPTGRRAASGPRRPLPAGAAPAMILTGAGALAAVTLLPFSGRMPLLAAALTYGIAAAVALSRVPRTHPHPRFGAANTATLIRLGGVAVFAALAVEPRLLAGAGGWQALAFALFLLALDG